MPAPALTPLKSLLCRYSVILQVKLTTITEACADRRCCQDINAVGMITVMDPGCSSAQFAKGKMNNYKLGKFIPTGRP